MALTRVMPLDVKIVQIIMGKRECPLGAWSVREKAALV